MIHDFFHHRQFAVLKVCNKIRELLDLSDEERIKQEECLNLLEMMVISHNKAKQKFFNGERNDQEVHSGTVVEQSQQSALQSITKQTLTLMML